MKLRHTVYYLVISILVLNCNQSKQDNRPGLLELAVDSLINPHLDSGIAGTVVGISRGNETLLLKAYGRADLEFNVPMPVDGSFQIGSITKQFTATSILQLVDEGKIKLVDDFTDYIAYDTQGRTVTINQLLDHTSGIKSYTELEEFGQIMMFDLPRDTLLRITEKAGFDFEPGEAVIYNNTAFFILGLIIEKVSEMTYEEYIKANIFDKVGMSNSYYCNERSVRINEVHGYEKGETAMRHAQFISQVWPFAAGSICSTVEDLLKWNQALHGGMVLSEAMYQKLITPGTLNDGTPLRYAKGLGVYDYEGNSIIVHGGGIPGFLSDGVYYPNEELTIVALVNSFGTLGPGQITDLIADKLLTKTPEDSAIYEGDISMLTGNYGGRARGFDWLVNIKKADQTLVFQDARDTFNIKYSESGYWFKNNTRYYFKKNGNELRIDRPAAHYVLKKINDK